MCAAYCKLSIIKKQRRNGDKMEQLNEKQLEMKRAEMILQLGEEVYGEIRRRNISVSDDMKEIAGQIVEIDKQLIQVKNSNLDTSDNICPECNNPIEDGNLFCPNCGFSIKEYNEKFTGICRVCGTKTVDGQKFCEACGLLLD